MTKEKELLIFGTKNMAIEIREIARAFYAKDFASIKTVYFTDDFVKDNGFDDKAKQVYFILGFGGKNRKSCLEALKGHPNFIAFSIIHPSAVIAKTAKIGRGCFIQPNSTISSNATLGDHCVINYNASVGHDTTLSDNIFIQPGARVSGNCQIGEGTLIGSNSFIFQNVKVGKECLIDALTYIHDDVQDRMLISSRHPKSISRDSLPEDKISMW